MGTSTGETPPSIRDAGKRRNVVGPVAAVSIYLPFVIFAAAACEVIGGEINGTMLVSTPAHTVPRFDRVALAQATSSAPPWAAGVVPRAAAAAGLHYVLFKNARFLLAVVVCVNRTS